MSFLCLQFLPKKELKQVDLMYHSSKIEFFRSFFGRIEETINCFRDLLTFTWRKSSIYVRTQWYYVSFFLRIEPNLAAIGQKSSHLCSICSNICVTNLFRKSLWKEFINSLPNICQMVAKKSCKTIWYGGWWPHSIPISPLKNIIGMGCQLDNNGPFFQICK